MMENQEPVLYFSSIEWKMGWIISFVFFFFFSLQSAACWGFAQQVTYPVGSSRPMQPHQRSVALSTLHSLWENDDSKMGMRSFPRFPYKCFTTFSRQTLYRLKVIDAPCHCIKQSRLLLSLYTYLLLFDNNHFIFKLTINLTLTTKQSLP